MVKEHYITMLKWYSIYKTIFVSIILFYLNLVSKSGVRMI
jgi:hypothetical protein